MNDRHIAAPDLLTAMRWYVSTLADPTLVPHMVSIDHSPTEQIIGAEWHHSALIISQNVEHQALADDLGKTLNPSTGVLRQWKYADQRYRTHFHQEFFHALRKYPVLTLAVSAKENTILLTEPENARQLGISGCYRRVELGGKLKLEFGPYVRAEGAEPEILTVTEKQAPMAIFNANYLLRIHSTLHQAVSERLGTPVPLWMQVMSDKPPNDFGGRYAELMWLLLGGPTTHGKFTWGGFTGDGDQPIDLLADNLAGLLNEITQQPEIYHYKGPELQPPVVGVFHWERLE
ncbi:hypothetical protein DLREEDagrD3_15030 [Denitratisoma sp. agr-D3]